MGHLSTHVLDTTKGQPARNVRVTLHRTGADGVRSVVKEAVTNANGRTDEALLSGDAFKPGTYELVFDVAQYFRETGAQTTEPPFFDFVPLRFTIAEPNGNYHVPLLISPWSYSTYRGS